MLFVLAEGATGQFQGRSAQAQLTTSVCRKAPFPSRSPGTGGDWELSWYKTLRRVRHSLSHSVHSSQDSNVRICRWLRPKSCDGAWTQVDRDCGLGSVRPSRRATRTHGQLNWQSISFNGMGSESEKSQRAKSSGSHLHYCGSDSVGACQ